VRQEVTESAVMKVDSDSAYLSTRDNAAQNLRIVRTRYLPWLLVAVVIPFEGYVRFRLRKIPLERDEGEYAYAGQLMLQGVPPYKLAYNMKLPGTYAAYAPRNIFAWTDDYTYGNYDLVGIADLLALAKSEHRWDEAAVGGVPRSQFNVLVFRRKPVG
jgi:hypothetical protein